MTELEMYAVELARPVFCEVVLSRFLLAVRSRCSTREDVDALYKLWRAGKAAQKKLRLVD